MSDERRCLEELAASASGGRMHVRGLTHLFDQDHRVAVGHVKGFHVVEPQRHEAPQADDAKGCDPPGARPQSRARGPSW